MAEGVGNKNPKQQNPLQLHTKPRVQNTKKQMLVRTLPENIHSARDTSQHPYVLLLPGRSYSAWLGSSIHKHSKGKD